MCFGQKSGLGPKILIWEPDPENSFGSGLTTYFSLQPLRPCLGGIVLVLLGLEEGVEQLFEPLQARLPALHHHVRDVVGLGVRYSRHDTYQ